MLKSIGSIQLALATVFVVPAVTGQDEGVTTLEAQLDATLSSLHYLSGLRNSAQAGEAGSMRAIIAATEEPREATPQRASRLQGLRDEISKLRYSLDRLLADPREVQAITSLPSSVLRTLGLGGEAPAVPTGVPTGTQPTGPRAIETPNTGTTSRETTPFGAPTRAPLTGTDATGAAATTPDVARPDVLAGTAPTIGLNGALHARIMGDIRPLDGVSPAARRRGDEALALEATDYVADAVRLGKLLVRADRPAEAIQILENAERTPATRYWLARAYQAQERLDEALEIFIVLTEDEKAGEYRVLAERDRDFLQFKRDFLRNRKSSRRDR